jgi:signal transduction histidine kinase
VTLRAVVVSLGGLALGVASLLVVHAAPDESLGGDSPVGVVALLGVGWAPLACGVVASSRRPGSRVGALLAAAGYAWFAAELANPGSGSGVAFTAGLVTYALAPAFVAHAALCYPDGRLSSTPERVAVAAAYVGCVLVLGLLPALVFDPMAQGCSQCPSNALVLTSDPGLLAALDRVGVGLGLAWSLGAIVLAGCGLARSSPAARRVSGPVLLPAVGYLGLVAAEYAHSLRRGFLSNDDIDDRLWVGQAVALATLVLGVVLTWARGRRARSAVARLVVELGETPPPGSLRDVLAEALGDPDLQVAYPVGDGGHVDAHGQPVGLPTADDRAVTTLLRGGQPVAVLLMRRDLRDDEGLVADVGAAARLALDHERLQALAHTQLRQLRQSRARTVAAADSERRRLEHDLHDGAQQRLVVLALALRLLRTELGEPALARIAAADADVHRALAELRELAHGIYPAVLTDEGLLSALQALGETAAVPLVVETTGAERRPAAVEAAAYFLVAEVVKRSTSSVAVNIRCAAGRLLVEIDSAANLDGDLVDLEDRIGALDGELSVARPPGRTTVRAEIPCAS